MAGAQIDLFDKFVKEAVSIGIGLDGRQIDALKKYIDMILEWMPVKRLVGSGKKDDILWLHVMDSFYAVEYIDREDKVLDVGSGSGFPGIPIQIAKPNSFLTLVESSRKKANFLREVKRNIGFENMEVFEGRIEQFNMDRKFMSVISRAVMEPKKWISVAENFIDEKGKIFVMLGKEWNEDEIEQACWKRKFVITDRRDYILPVAEHRRTILKIQKKACFT